MPEENREPIPDKSPSKPLPVGAGFVFSLIMSFLLGGQAIDFSYSRVASAEEIILKTKTPDILWLVICAPLIGIGLGVEVDKSEIGRAISKYLSGRSEQ